METLHAGEVAVPLPVLLTAAVSRGTVILLCDVVARRSVFEQLDWSRDEWAPAVEGAAGAAIRVLPLSPRRRTWHHPIIARLPVEHVFALRVEGSTPRLPSHWQHIEEAWRERLPRAAFHWLPSDKGPLSESQATLMRTPGRGLGIEGVQRLPASIEAIPRHQHDLAQLGSLIAKHAARKPVVFCRNRSAMRRVAAALDAIRLLDVAVPHVSGTPHGPRTSNASLAIHYDPPADLAAFLYDCRSLKDPSTILLGAHQEPLPGRPVRSIDPAIDALLHGDACRYLPLIHRLQGESMHPATTSLDCGRCDSCRSRVVGFDNGDDTWRPAMCV